YLKDLIEYRKVIKQRNALLSNMSMSFSVLESMIEPWNDQLVQLGSSITFKRAQVLQSFGSYLDSGYETIAGIGHKPGIEYKSCVEDTSTLESIKHQFGEIVRSDLSRERERQLTLNGPH